MKHDFLFSVIIPIYNTEPFLPETVQSVLEQNIGFREHIQLILVNDGSTDNSEQICLDYQARYPDNVVYIRQENAGVSAARNAGIPYIRGKYVNFLDSDDLWASDAFSHFLHFFEGAGAKVGFAAARMRFFGQRRDYHSLDYRFSPKTPERIANPLRSYLDIHFHVGPVMIRAERIGFHRFDPGVALWEDAFFLNQLLLENPRYGVLYYPEFFYRKREDATSLTQTQRLNPDWFFNTPERGLKALAEKSIARYGRVPPFIQATIFHDLAFRMKVLPHQLKLSPEELESHLTLLRTILQRYISDYVIFTQRHHRREIQLQALKLKYGSQLSSHLMILEDKLYFDSFPLVHLRKDKKLLKITGLSVRKNTLLLEGTLRKWLVDVLGPGCQLILEVSGQPKQKVRLTPLPDETYYTLEGTEAFQLSFQVKIPLVELQPGEELTIKPVLSFWKRYSVPLPYAFANSCPLAHQLPNLSHRFFGRYLAAFRPPVLVLSCPRHPRRERLRLEWALERALHRMGKGALNRLRRQTFLLRRLGKPVYLGITGPEGTNTPEQIAELVRHCPPGMQCHLVPRKEGADPAFLAPYGAVLAPLSRKHLLCTLRAKEIRDISGRRKPWNPFLTDRPYLKDLLRERYHLLPKNRLT